MFLHPRRGQIDVVQSVGLDEKSEGQGSRLCHHSHCGGTRHLMKALNDNKKYQVVWQIQCASCSWWTIRSRHQQIELGEDVSDRIEIISGVAGDELEATTSVVEDIKPKAKSKEEEEDEQNLGKRLKRLSSWRTRAIVIRTFWSFASNQSKDHHKCGTWLLGKLGEWYCENCKSACRPYQWNSCQLWHSRKRSVRCVSWGSRRSKSGNFREWRGWDAYSTHHHPSSVRFTISVIDLRQKMLSQQWKPFSGVYTLTYWYWGAYPWAILWISEITSRGNCNSDGAPDTHQRPLRPVLSKCISNDDPRLGIVYTPIEVVDFIIHSVEDVLRDEFDSSLADDSVRILDPFTGTGTFITRLMQSGLILKNDFLQIQEWYPCKWDGSPRLLRRVYQYWSGLRWPCERKSIPTVQRNGTHDTFQLYEQNGTIADLLPDNSQRRTEQKKRDITVVVSNPPIPLVNSPQMTMQRT